MTSTSRRDNRPESRDKEDAFVLGNKAKDLYIYTSEAIGNTNIIPKHRRHTAGQRLENMTFEIMDKCYLANTKSLKTKREERQALQEEIMALCLVFENLINALKASKVYPGVDAHKAAIWTQKSMDVRFLCAAWYKSDMTRH